MKRPNLGFWTTAIEFHVSPSHRIGRRSHSFLQDLHWHDALSRPCLHHDACGASHLSHKILLWRTWSSSATPFADLPLAGSLPSGGGSALQSCFGVHSSQFCFFPRHQSETPSPCCGAVSHREASRAPMSRAPHRSLAREALPVVARQLGIAVAEANAPEGRCPRCVTCMVGWI